MVNIKKILYYITLCIKMQTLFSYLQKKCKKIQNILGEGDEIWLNIFLIDFVSKACYNRVIIIIHFKTFNCEVYHEICIFEISRRQGQSRYVQL